MSTTHDDPEIDLLFQAVLDQKLTSTQLRRLEQILLSDPRARSDYLRLTELDHLLQLCHHSDETVKDVLTVSSAERIGAGRRTKRFWMAWGAISLVVVGILLLTSQRPTPEMADVPIPAAAVDNEKAIAATLTSSLNARWGETAAESILPDGSQWSVGDWIELEKGTAILTFQNGVKCAVSGAALFKVDDRLNCHLDVGTVAFDVPKVASGFTVHTKGGSFVDIGTTFGVQVNNKGITEVHVLDGIVDAKSDSHQIVRLNSGHAASLNSHNGRLTDTKFRPENFSRSMAYLAGVESFSGPMAFWSQPLVNVVPNRELDLRYVWLCQEQSQVVLDQPLTVNSIATDARGTTRSDTVVVAAGTLLKSYLLHFGHDNPPQDQAIHGTIRFKTPIAAIVRSPSDLERTDGLFCFPQTATTLDKAMTQTRGSNEPKDYVAIGSDRRTIEFNLSTNGLPNVDQFRVLVFETNPLAK